MTRPLYPHHSEWPVVSLEPDAETDVILQAASGSTPSTSDPTLWGGPYPWLTPKEVTGENTPQYVAATERTVTAEGANAAGRRWEPRTVMLTKRAPVGSVVMNAVPMATNQGFMNFRCGSRLLPDYLYYWLQANTRYLEAVANGSTYPELYASDLFEFELALPPLSVQLSIVECLASIDRKLELNRAQDHSLFAMAEAIFKSWFVDFDPTRAEELNGAPRLEPTLQRLFTSGFGASPIGEIPAEWTTAVLDDLLDETLGGDWGEDAPTGSATNPTLCIRGADIPSLQQGGVGAMPTRFVKTSSLAKRSLRDGDIVIEISGGSPTQSTGRPVLVTAGLLKRLPLPLTCSNFCRAIRPRTPALSRFIYFWLRWLYSQNELLRFENGTTGIKNLAFTLFSESYKLVVPPREILESFDALVSPLIVLQQSHGAENDTLRMLRSLLLPRLIAGKISVIEASRITKAL